MKQIIIFFIIIIVLALFSTSNIGVQKVFATSYTAAELLTGNHTVEFSSKQFPGKCLDVQNGSTNNQTPVQMYDCLGNSYQKFSVVPVNSSLVSIQFNGKCVDIMWGGTANGTKVWLWDCTYGSSQLWQPIDNDTYMNPQSGRCLDGESGTNGTQLKIWDCNGLNYQNWNTNSPSQLSQPINVEMSNKQYPGRCMDVQFGHINSGTPIQLYDCYANYEQRNFYIVPYTSNLVNIKYQNKCLDIQGAGTANGTLIQLYDCTGNVAQQWVRTASDSFRNPNSNKCLDVSNGGANGMGLWIWDCGANSQNWNIETPTEILNGATNIDFSSKQYAGKCIDTQGSNVIMNDCSTNQRFDAVPWNENSISIRYQGKCFDTQGGGSANGTQVQLQNCRTLADPQVSTQQWVPYGNNIFRDQGAFKCLYAPSGNNGTPVQIFDCNGTNSEKWGYNTVLGNSFPGNILNLNFGITNLDPWMQFTCGGVRMDNGLTNEVPTTSNSTPYTIQTGTSCTNPGVFVSGDSSVVFGSAGLSASNYIAGGGTYPEVYSSTGSHLSTSYSIIEKKAKSNNLPIYDLSTKCNLTNCTIPATLPHGVWKANGDLTLNAFTLPANSNYVFLVNGKTTLNGAISSPQNQNNTFMLSSTDTISVSSSVGVAANVLTSSLDGIFTSDKSFIVSSANNCNDLRLNVTGAIVTNAARGGGSLQNKRDFCTNNTFYPTFTVTQRPDLLLNLPGLVLKQQSTTTEVAP
jgi:hypothetical protein